MKKHFIVQRSFVGICVERGRGMKKSVLYAFSVLTLMFLGFAMVSMVFGQPENIRIVSYTYYLDNAGFLDVVGQVQNVGSNTVDPVILTGSI